MKSRGLSPSKRGLSNSGGIGKMVQMHAKSIASAVAAVQAASGQGSDDGSGHGFNCAHCRTKCNMRPAPSKNGIVEHLQNFGKTKRSHPDEHHHKHHLSRKGRSLMLIVQEFLTMGVGILIAASGVIAYDTYKSRKDKTTPLTKAVNAGYDGAITMGGIGFGIAVFSFMRLIRDVLNDVPLPQFLEDIVLRVSDFVPMAFIMIYIALFGIFSGICAYWMNNLLSTGWKDPTSADKALIDAEQTQILLFFQIGMSVGLFLGALIDFFGMLIKGGTGKIYMLQVFGIIAGLMSVVAGCLGIFIYEKINKVRRQLIAGILYLVIGVLLVIALIAMMVFMG